MENLLEQIALCIQRGKIDAVTAYPPDMKGMKGAGELTLDALNSGIDANRILSEALIPAMSIVGDLFRENKLFVPQVLMSAKAMSTAMVHLKPYFNSGAIAKRGTFVIGTVSGDLHDIGKNLVAMMVEGNGWSVIDLGIDVKSDKFIEAAQMYPDAIIGMSALLTTTMESMKQSVGDLKNNYPKRKIVVGGAPLSHKFASEIGADLFAPDPTSMIQYLNTNIIIQS